MRGCCVVLTPAATATSSGLPSLVAAGPVAGRHRRSASQSPQRAS
jgi:hypothetical protein